MITFKEYLLEADSTDLVKVLNRDCAEFFSQTHRAGLLVRGMRDLRGATLGHFANPLYSGRRGQTTVIEYAVKTPRTDRKPADTPRRAHVMLDRWFDAKFGVKARSNAVFCYPPRAKQHAMQYGDMYAVFPIGDFRIIWSPNVDDLYGELETSFLTKMRRGEYEDDDAALDDYLSDKHYTDKDLNKAMKSRSELMLICSKYYAFSYGEYASMLAQVLEIDTKIHD